MTDHSRRSVVRGVAAAAVAGPLTAACGSGTDDEAAPPKHTGSASSGSGASGSGISASQVPVGGGTIVSAQQTVVTQPAEGDFKAFSSICTHAGCPVQEITGQDIVCGCHGSRFSIEDGSVVQGPATEPLASRKVSVSGGRIHLG